MLTIFERGQPGYEDTLASLSRRGDEDLARVEPDVRAILDAVRERGDEAVLEYTERFDRRRPPSLLLNVSLAAVIVLALWASVRAIANRDVTLLRVLATALPTVVIFLLALLVWPLLPGLMAWLVSGDP